ncbi:MAG: glycosyltransferase [Acidimicrobiia bacterium]|nr:glycosyltransferase [Acidimicrobiia bacterium]
MPRVLVVVENLSVPFDRRVWQECRSLVGAGFEVSVICPTGAGYDTERYASIEGVEIHRYPLVEAKEGPLGYLREYGTALWRTRRLAARLARQRPFDVVHLCNPPDLLFVATAALRGGGARLVFDHHDLVPELLESKFSGRRPLLRRVVEKLERMTFDRADFVLCTNESYRDVALGRGGLPADRVMVVRSAPDLSRFHETTPDPSLRRGRAASRAATSASWDRRTASTTPSGRWRSTTMSSAGPTCTPPSSAPGPRSTTAWPSPTSSISGTTSTSPDGSPTTS